MNRKIQLINVYSKNKELLQDYGYLPIGLLSIANTLKQNGYDVEIIDTQRETLGHIQETIDHAIIGLNYTIMTVDLLDIIIKYCKKKNAVIIVGGQAATPVAKQLLHNNYEIDYVVKNDGEEAMYKLVQLLLDGDGSIEKIPNLVYRKNGCILENQVNMVKQSTLPILDRCIPGIDMEWYINNFKSFGYPEVEEPWYRVTNSFSNKGCPRRYQKKGCSFCARIDSQLNSKTPLQVYKEYSDLREKYGVNYIFDDSDSWIRPGLMRGLIDCYEELGDLEVKLRVYGDIRDINKETIELMKRLNVVSILLGIESGCERILHGNYKPLKKEEILTAIRMLAENDITVCASYVLGLMEEDNESLNQTIVLAREISTIGNLQTNYWNMITPLPGSPIWSEMMEIPYLKEKYGDDYKFNLKELRSDYIDHFCNLGYDGYDYLTTLLEVLLEEMNAPALVREYMR